MDGISYTEETITTMPHGTFIREQIQTLQSDLNSAGTARDEMLILLFEISEAESGEELKELLTKVKNFVEQLTYPTPY